jgi:VWFA-related protein
MTIAAPPFARLSLLLAAVLCAPPLLAAAVQSDPTQEAPPPQSSAAPQGEAASPQPAPLSDPRGPFTGAVDVRLTELYLTVTDAAGDPVRGLPAEAFTLEENGVAQQIDSVKDAADLPLTLGLAIDTSASMFVKLEPVSDAARSLLESLESGRDRSFLVAFGPEPRVAVPVTEQLNRVRSGLRWLEPRGSTPLWSSIVLALDELSQVRGKRALVVFFDGADDDGDTPYREALERARAVGVPIYLILMNNEAARTAGKEFRTRAFIARLERLAAAGGGEVHFVRTDDDLEATYRRIENELRSYYLLTYYPEIPRQEGRHREVEVKVVGDGLTARTISGYEPEG